MVVRHINAKFMKSGLRVCYFYVTANNLLLVQHKQDIVVIDINALRKEFMKPN